MNPRRCRQREGEGAGAAEEIGDAAASGQREAGALDERRLPFRARLQESAHPGTMIVSEAVWRRVEDEAWALGIRGERLSPSVVRGRRQPVETVEITLAAPGNQTVATQRDSAGEKEDRKVLPN